MTYSTSSEYEGTPRNSPEFWQALALIRANVEQPKKTASNPHFKSNFAPIGEVLRVANIAMGKDWVLVLDAQAPAQPQGYSFESQRNVMTQPPSTESSSTDTLIWEVNARLVWCKTGEEISVSLPIIVNGDMTKQGASLSYNLRRAVIMLFAMDPEDDDDGQSTMPRQRPAAAPQRTGANANDFWSKVRTIGFDRDKAQAIAQGAGSWDEKMTKLEAK